MNMTAAPPTDPLIGKILEKVCLLSKLGSGGMGAVYLAEHQTLGKKVAVKILPDHLSRDPEYVARFRREAATCAKLEHVNLVQVFDVGSAEGRFFIVMQYVEGESLQAIIEQLGSIEPHDAARVAIGILRGMQHAHDAGIVHRDIKPDNVLITKGNLPKILDFGLAIETEATQKLTADGTVVGTPYFISPEQARGRKADARSDLYALGVTLYYMVTGRVPFTGQTALAVLNKHIHETPISPTHLNAKIPETLNDIILKLMSKRPEDRYLSAESAARDLLAFIEGRFTGPVTRKQAPHDPPKSGKGLSIAIASAAAVLIVIAIAVASNTKVGVPKPVPGPGPGPERIPEVDVYKPERDKLAALIDEANAAFGDHSSFRKMMERFDAFATLHKGDPLHVMALDAQEKYLWKIEELAQEEWRKLEPELMAQKNVFAQADVLRRFPKGLLEIPKTGQDVRKRMGQLDEACAKFVDDELKEIARLTGQERFDEARAKLKVLLDHATTRRSDITGAVAAVNEKEPPAIVAATKKIRPALETLMARLDEMTGRGATTAAWRAAIEFVTTRGVSTVEGKVVRAPGVDYDALGKLDPEKATEAELEIAIGVIAKDFSDPKEEPASEIMFTLDELLRAEWLQRRAVKGIQRVSGGPFFLEGQKGTIASGEPPTFAPEGAGARPIMMRMLAPADVVALAAAAEFGATGPVAEAFQKSPLICLAAAAAYLHSRVTDRKNGARRWLTQASAIGASVPVWRIADLDREADVEIEEITKKYIAPAHELANKKKWDEAAKALDEVEARTKGLDLYMTLGGLIRKHRVKFLVDEAKAALDARNYARVRELARHLNAKYDDEFDADAVAKLSWSALLGMGSWDGDLIPSSTGFLGSGDRWGWDGKLEKVPAPAKIEDDPPSMRLDRGRRMMLNPKNSNGANGMSAKVRLNDLRQSWTYGFYFDVTEKDAQMKWIAVTSKGNLEYYTVEERKSTLQAAAPLPIEIKVGKYFELAWVADKEAGELVFYVERQPVLTVKSVLEAKNAVGLQAEGDVSFKDLKLRRGK